MSWELGFFVGAALLAVAIAYGMLQARRAGPAADARAEAGARAVYADQGDRDASPRGGRQKGLPPLVFIIVGILLLWMIVAAAMTHRSAGMENSKQAEAAAEAQPAP